MIKREEWIMKTSDINLRGLQDFINCANKIPPVLEIAMFAACFLTISKQVILEECRLQGVRKLLVNANISG